MVDNVKEYSGKQVFIMACSDCNLNCAHCYIEYGGGFDKAELLALCQALVTKYTVKLNGTELLLHPEYFDILRYIKQDYILTNGLALQHHPEYAKSLNDAGIKYVGISYHLFAGSGLETIEQNTLVSIINCLHNHGIKCDVRTTITQDNYDKCAKICEIAYELGADGIKFTNLMNAGNAKKTDTLIPLSNSQISTFLNDLDDVRAKYNKGSFLIRRCGSFGCGNSKRFTCVAGIDSVVITPELKVYPCLFLISAGNEIGYVSDGHVIISKPYIHDQSQCVAKLTINQQV